MKKLLLPLLLILAACDQKEAPQTPVRAEPVAAAPAAPASPAAAPKAALMEPASLNEQAPETYKAKFVTTKGEFIIEVRRNWSPNGADRFYNLVKNGFYDDMAFFRVVPGFMAQFGVTGNPDLNARWRQAAIKDDPVKQSNKPGMITFATGGPNTRTTQVFINFGDNGRLDQDGFSPFGSVVQGFDVVKSLYGGYGDGPPYGRGPDQGRIQTEGNAYLKRDFPQMDYIKTATLVP